MKRLLSILVLSIMAVGAIGVSQDGIVRSNDDKIDYEYYRKLAVMVGQEYGIRWRVLYGVWMQESLVLSLDPKVKGDKRSYRKIVAVKKGKHKIVYDTVYTSFGIGQIHLETARHHFDKNITAELLLNPEINSRASAAILKDYIDIFDGDEMYGIAAYNMGPTDVKKRYKRNQLPKNYQTYVRKVYKYSWSTVDGPEVWIKYDTNKNGKTK